MPLRDTIHRVLFFYLHQKELQLALSQVCPQVHRCNPSWAWPITKISLSRCKENRGLWSSVLLFQTWLQSSGTHQSFQNLRLQNVRWSWGYQMTGWVEASQDILSFHSNWGELLVHWSTRYRRRRDWHALRSHWWLLLFSILLLRFGKEAVVLCSYLQPQSSNQWWSCLVLSPCLPCSCGYFRPNLRKLRWCSPGFLKRFGCFLHSSALDLEDRRICTHKLVSFLRICSKCRRCLLLVWQA